MVRSLGNIEPIIKAHETTHPVPPRDPNIEITLDPERVSPESELSRKSLIIAKVTNCNGEPVYDRYRNQRVFFQKTTERGMVRTKVVGEYPLELKDYEFDYTIKDGIAHAHYTLTKGIEAGEDKVTIVTFGRGLKRVTATAIIKINGIGIEVKPEKSELAPRQDTLIHIDLYEEDKEGNRKPLEAKVVHVDKRSLKDSELIPLGATDMLGNPKTDYRGRATLKFIAGKKEGLIKIPVTYQTELGEVHDTAVIKIKKEEFVVLIDWRQNFEVSGTIEYSASHQYDGRSESHASTHDSQDSYSYYYTSRTIWERLSRSERTSADLTFNRQYKSFSSGSGGWSDTGRCGSGSGRSYYSNQHSAYLSLNSKVSNRKTTMLGVDRSGNLYIRFPIGMLIVGQASYSGSGSGGGGGSSYDSCTDWSYSGSWSSSGHAFKTVTYDATSIQASWSRSYDYSGSDHYTSGDKSWSYTESRADSSSDSRSLDTGWIAVVEPSSIYRGYAEWPFEVGFGSYVLTNPNLPTDRLLPWLGLKLNRTGKDSYEPFDHSIRARMEMPN
ncbi:MAG: hypothetical protein EFT35_00460 [Methanophagales archaeon ANME-1-THS]|nr:MAG: hypothetical protein EFT35_00460 [Methanophagales archaeon ANME-1-THS]